MQYAHLLLTIICLSLSLTAYSAVYVTTDADGNVSYSDSPSGGAKEVTITEKTTLIEHTKIKKSALIKKVEKKSPTVKSAVQILHPVNDSTIRNNNGIVDITLGVLPELNDEHSIQVFLDGELQTQQSQATSFTLLDVYRGTHTIYTVLLNKKGTVIAESNKITIHMHRNRQQQINN